MTRLAPFDVTRMRSGGPVIRRVGTGAGGAAGSRGGGGGSTGAGVEGTGGSLRLLLRSRNPVATARRSESCASFRSGSSSSREQAVELPARRRIVPIKGRLRFGVHAIDDRGEQGLAHISKHRLGARRRLEVGQMMKRVDLDDRFDGLPRLISAVECQERQHAVVANLDRALVAGGVQMFERRQRALVISRQVELADFRERVLVCGKGRRERETPAKGSERRQCVGAEQWLPI